MQIKIKITPFTSLRSATIKLTIVGVGEKMEIYKLAKCTMGIT